MQRLVCCVHCSIDFQLGVCECLNCMFSKTAVPVFLAVRICRSVDRVVGHPQPPFSGIVLPLVSLLGPTLVP